MLGLLLLILSIYCFQKGKFYPSLMLFFLFVTNGFQVIPVNWLMFGLPLDKGSDLGILYTAVLFVMNRWRMKLITQRFPVFKLSGYLILFVLADVAYSLFILDYSLANVLQVFRPYLIFLIVPVFFGVPQDDLKKALNSVAFITVFQSVLFLLQIASGITILLSASGDANVHTGLVEGTSYMRFYNAPMFLNAALFYFLFVYRFKNTTLKYLVWGILFLTVIGPMHRSLMLTIIAVISVYLLLKKSSGKGALYLSAIGLGIYALSFIDVVGNRLNDAFTDMYATFNSNLSVQYIDINDNNLTFRVGHFIERFQYVIQSFDRWLFGIGMISDNAAYAAKLPFQFGLVSETTGRVAQIDTGDITRSPLMLNLGIFGAAFYFFLFVRYMIFFYRKTSASAYAVVGFLLILASFLTSMAGTELMSTGFRTMVLLLMVIAAKDYWSRMRNSQIQKKYYAA